MSKKITATPAEDDRHKIEDADADYISFEVIPDHMIGAIMGASSRARGAGWAAAGSRELRRKDERKRAKALRKAQSEARQ